MTIEHLPIDSLKPHAMNPRTISQSAFERLQVSLDSFGMDTQPIVINKRTGLIASGHQRWRAAKELHWETVPVTYVDLDPKRAEAFMVAMNNKEAQGETDTDVMAELIATFDDEMKLLTLYNDEEIAKLQDGYVDHDEEKKEVEEKFTIKQLKSLAAKFVENGGGTVPAFIDWLDRENS